MKNKKNDYEISTIILLILGIVILVILILGFTLGWNNIAPWLDKQEFKITQEVCYNETIYLHKQCFYDEKSLYIDVIKCQAELEYSVIEAKKEACEQQEVDEIEVKDITYGIKELQKEIFLENNVSFLVILKTNEDRQYIDIVKNKYLYAEMYCLERDNDTVTMNVYDGEPNFENCNFEEFNITSYDEIVNIDKISKEELDISWLETNCECLDKPYGLSSCKWDIPNDCLSPSDTPEISVIDTSRQECLDCGQEYIFPDDCTEYKCGDYIVEII
jgi:hypothetical protein